MKHFHLIWRYFKGDMPCSMHKRDGAVCRCSHYQKVSHHILIIKLGARGDVIRTTPLLRRLAEEYPAARMYWVTDFPDCVPSCVDVVLPFNERSVLFLETAQFDVVYNFDKDREACALMHRINAKKKKGFTLSAYNVVMPIDENAEHALRVGIDDTYARTHKRSYPDELFEIAGYQFAGEQYVLDMPHIESRGYIGLNTGCGVRWHSRLWDEGRWITLASSLVKSGKKVLLLGGPDEHEKNLRIQKASGAEYFGHAPLSRFIEYISYCDLIVTTVTMALHYAIGLNKKVVLFNNIFNKAEFELYGLGTILEPDVSCKGCYKNACDTRCMDEIVVTDVVVAIEKQLAV